MKANTKEFLDFRFNQTQGRFVIVLREVFEPPPAVRVRFLKPYDYGNPWHMMQESEGAILYPDYRGQGWSRLVPLVYHHTVSFACPYIPLIPFECDDLLEILEYVRDY